MQRNVGDVAPAPGGVRCVHDKALYKSTFLTLPHLGAHHCLKICFLQLPPEHVKREGREDGGLFIPWAQSWPRVTLL